MLSLFIYNLIVKIISNKIYQPYNMNQSHSIQLNKVSSILNKKISNFSKDGKLFCSIKINDDKIKITLMLICQQS